MLPCDLDKSPSWSSPGLWNPFRHTSVYPSAFLVGNPVNFNVRLARGLCTVRRFISPDSIADLHARLRAVITAQLGNSDGTDSRSHLTETARLRDHTQDGDCQAPCLGPLAIRASTTTNQASQQGARLLSPLSSRNSQ